MTIEAGATVRSVDNPGREGMVTNAPAKELQGGRYLQVRWFNGGTDLLHEDELESAGGLGDPFLLLQSGRFGRAADLRRNLNFLHLSGKLANLVYALGITDTDFYPHQYRPLLTLLDSPINGLLIADEVGLGKTIEAGLIWTELRARFGLRRLLIVCPAILREKWKTELGRRFGVRSEIADAHRLFESLDAGPASDDVARIVSYQAVRPPGGWRPDSGLNASTDRERLTEFLHACAQNERRPIDMVVFDEAHYMRNPENPTHRLGKLLRDASEYQVMLSATPINLKNQDLLSLLRLLDPDHLDRPEDFQLLLDANEPVVKARDVVLDRRSSAAQILECLLEAQRKPLLRNSVRLSDLIKQPPTDEELANGSRRADLAGDLERLNLLGHVLSRTRKRDLEQKRIQRRPYREAVQMADCELELYKRVTEVIREYAIRHSVSDGFLLAMPQRQVTSCPAAAAEAWLEGQTQIDDDLADERADQIEEGSGDREQHPLRDFLISKIAPLLDPGLLRQCDTKFTRLLQMAKNFFEDYPQEKVILFTTFRPTARYLVDRLNLAGFPAVLISGGPGKRGKPHSGGGAFGQEGGNKRQQIQNQRQEILDLFRDRPEARFLISTEVAAEGLDMQFCRVLINYDLPWNPMRIEQRIGRIDRLGQEAESIQIWNLYFCDTLDERVVERLMERIGIFEAALGSAEAIVGSEISKLETALLSRHLTRAEEDREIERAEIAVGQARQREKDLEDNAAHMIAHGQRVLEQVEAARELARHVTDSDLRVYVQDYLEKHWDSYRFEQDGNDPLRFTIQLPAGMAADLSSFVSAQGLVGNTELDSGNARRCVFHNRISAQPKAGGEIIHQFHPLIGYISGDLKSRSEPFYPLVAVRVQNRVHALGIPAGTYAVFARCWSFSGVREEEELAVAAVEVGSNHEVDQESSEQLLQVARAEGCDWLGASEEVDLKAALAAAELAENQLNHRYRTVLERKRGENRDRARFQLDSIERHLQRRLRGLEEVKRNHALAGRHGLVRATEGQIGKLKSQMEVRRARIRVQEEIRPEKRIVCAGLIRLE